MDEQLKKLINGYTEAVELAISKTKQYNDVNFVNIAISDIERMLVLLKFNDSDIVVNVQKYMIGLLDELNEVKHSTVDN